MGKNWLGGKLITDKMDHKIVTAKIDKLKNE